MNLNKQLGQNYLISKKIVTKIIENSEIRPDETVCEMGSGKGAMTFDLCKTAKSVKSFEIDKKLYEQLFKKSLKYKNLELINEDILKYEKPLAFDVFVSNIPYSRSRDTISWLATKRFNRALIMVQKEFADKLRASKTEANYRAISAISQYCFDIHKLFDVEKDAFFPRPKIESEAIKLTPKNLMITMNLISIIHYIFSFKNKKVAKITKKNQIHLELKNTRIRELNPVEIFELAKKLLTFK